MARRAMAQDNPESALRSLLRTEDRSGDWYYVQGQALMAMEEYDSAHQSFREAVRRDPDNKEYRCGALDAFIAGRNAKKLPMRVKKILRRKSR
jgi:cytochrome c-type biogenesis protein CcmH/NrfG